MAGGSERTQILSLAWLPYFVVASYILLPEKIQRKSYNVFVTIFAVTLILPILWYILTHLGFRIPYSILESYEEIKVIRGKFYKLYPLATQITSRWDPLYQELHLCGIYDEAGRVGTLAGLVLVSEKYRLKGNWKNIIILIAGILSFSLAFYAIAVVYYLVSCFDKKKYKNIARKSVDKYISNQARRLGISSNEIKNRLPESYSFSDIDSICEDLQEYKVNINNLPFSTNNRLREDVGIRASNVSNRTLVPVEEEVDELTLRLAGITK